MARAPHPARDQAISDIRNLVAFHGDQAEGERAARAKWADIPATTFAGWCQLARRPTEVVSVRQTSARSSASPAADEKPLTFEQRIAGIDDHIAMLVTSSTREVVDEVTGVVRRVARNPTMLATAVRLQSQACELLVRYAATVSDLGKVDEFMRVVIDEIGKVSPEMQQAIMVRMRELAEQQDGARFGLGLGHVLPVVSTPASHPEVDF